MYSDNVCEVRNNPGSRMQIVAGFIRKGRHEDEGTEEGRVGGGGEEKKRRWRGFLFVETIHSVALEAGFCLTPLKELTCIISFCAPFVTWKCSSPTSLPLSKRDPMSHTHTHTHAHTHTLRS